MQTSLTKNWKLPPTWLRFLIIILLAIGIFFRFSNIDKKLYWRDEALTSLTISGYTQTEAIQKIFNGNLLSIEDLEKYKRINPEKGTIDTIKSLAAETPEHPPLYYVMVRWWVQLFGNSVTATRSLSILFSLLVFPCIYWLCLELFESLLVGWIAVALIGVSPFHVLYAQEAREYSLWTVTVLLSSAALLRAMRLEKESRDMSGTWHVSEATQGIRRRVIAWSIYAITLALAFYTYLFSIFVAVAHAIYVFTILSFRVDRTFIRYLLAAMAGLLAFMPWLVAIITNLSELRKSMDWINYKLTLPGLATRWIFNLSRVFIDWNYGWSFKTPFPYLIIVSVLIMVVYSIYFLCRNAPKRVWLFIVTLIGITALALVAPDLLFGGQRSRVSRYLIPCYLGIQLAVAYLFASKITSNAINVDKRSQKVWLILMGVLFSSGVLSCALSSQAQVWWNKPGTNIQMIRTVNKATRPLLISDTPLPTNVLSLSYLLDRKVKFQLVVQPNIPKIPDGFSDVFLFNASKGLKDKLKTQKYKIRSLDGQIE